MEKNNFWERGLNSDKIQSVLNRIAQTRWEFCSKYTKSEHLAKIREMQHESLRNKQFVVEKLVNGWPKTPGWRGLTRSPTRRGEARVLRAQSSSPRAQGAKSQVQDCKQAETQATHRQRVAHRAQHDHAVQRQYSILPLGNPRCAKIP